MCPNKKRDINPLTTTQFMKPLYNTITVMPVSRSNYTDLPFNNIGNNEFDFSHNTNNNIYHNKSNDDQLINGDTYDHSELGNADPDSIFLVNNRQTISTYYNERSFNESYQHSNTFSLFHVNIRSIPRNLDKLELHLDSLKHNFSIIAISESWLTSINKDVYHLKGYTHKYEIGEHRARGGVSLFVNNNIRFEVRSDIKVNLDDVNTLFIEISKNSIKSDKNVIVGICYRPPQVCAQKFIQELHFLLDRLHKMNKVVYLLGDFNINTFRSEAGLNKIANDFSNLFLSYFYQPLIDKPTREVNTSSTLLDNIYTNESESGNICTSGIMKTDFSDYYSIFSMSNLKIKPKTDNIVLRRDFSESNKAKFYKAMKNFKWGTIYKIENAQSAYEYFEAVILELFENFFRYVK